GNLPTKPLYPGVGGLLPEPGAQTSQELIAMRIAVGERPEVRIGCQVREVHQRDQVAEEVLLGTRHGDIAVGGLEELERDEAGVSRQWAPLGDGARREVPGGQVG